MAIYSKKTADELGTAILRASRTACLTLFQHVEPLESATSRGLREQDKTQLASLLEPSSVDVVRWPCRFSSQTLSPR
ncbi:hypothetical protein EMIT0324P_20585 [Pseudomonas chlororaphis]